MVRSMSGPDSEVVVRFPTTSLFIRRLLPVVILTLIGASCAAQTDAAGGDEDDQTAIQTVPGDVARTTIVPTMQPTTAEALGIALDPEGRPYDNGAGAQGTVTEQRLLASMVIDDGRILLMDGEAFLSRAPIADADRETVNFRNQTTLDVNIVWQRDAAEEDGPEQILGVRIGVRDAVVAEWGRFDEAYSASGGLGGVISRTAFDWARFNLSPGDTLLPAGPTEDRPFVLADVAGETGRDVLIFDTGEDTDDFVYADGFDEDGRLVAIMIWDGRFPWRLAVPDGTPPPDVTEREDELIDCIEGRRTIDRWGRCT